MMNIYERMEKYAKSQLKGEIANYYSMVLRLLYLNSLL